MNLKFTFVDLGLKEYKEAWDYQDMMHSGVLTSRENSSQVLNAGMLIFCEHPHVFTLGKSGEQNNLLISPETLKKINASCYRSNRGGDITYHGPGQLVGYPVFDLEKLKLGVKEYIRRLEESVILTLAEYHIDAARMEHATGVWLDSGTPSARKICAIGVRVSKAVTMHGFALNITTDLNYFSHINPCGYTDKGVTSMQKESGRPVDFAGVSMKMKKNIARVFDLKAD